MLRLWLGRAGSGKSSAVLREMALLPAEKRAYLIVPEQASHEAERWLCREGGDGVSLHCEVLSFTRLAARVFAEAGGGAEKEIDQGGRILLMHRALKESAGQLTVYAAHSGKAEFLEQLLLTSDELKSCRILPEQLREAAEEAGSEGDKLRDLALICGAYDALVNRAGADPRDRLTRLAAALRECSWGTGADFYLDGFVDFTPQEREVLRLLLGRAARVTALLTCGGTEKEDPSGVFSAARKTARQLKKLAEEESCPWEETLFTRKAGTEGPMEKLEANLFATEPETGMEQQGHIQLFRAGSVHGEAEWAASEILRLVREKGYCFRDIGVAARNFESCGDVVEAVFRQYGVPLFRAVRTPVLEKPVLKLVTAALSAAAEGYRYDDMFRYLKTGLTPLTMEECDKLENYVLTWDIRGSRWTQKKPWSWHPEGYGRNMTEEDRQQVEELDRLRRTAIAPLEKLRKSGAKTGREQAMVLYRFLEEIELPRRLSERAAEWREEGDLNRAEEYRQLWDIFVSALEQCAQLLDDMPMELPEFASLFQLVLSQYDIGNIPVSLDRVTAGDMMRVTGHGRKALFLLGADSGSIPQVTSAGGLLSDEDRTLLASLGMESANRLDERLEREMNILYQSCAGPRELLAVSWTGQGSDGGEKQPCFLVDRLRLLFSDLTVREEEAEREEIRLAAPGPALAAAAEEETVYRALLHTEQWQAAARRVEEARNWDRGHLSRGAVDRLYGKRVPMSASRMDKYKQCHFSFFMQYGLNAKARRGAGFQAPEYGTFVHAVLERVFRTAGELGGVKALSEEDVKKLTDEAIGDYVRVQLGGLSDETPRFRYLFRRLTDSVRAVVRNMAEELRRSDFQPVAFELGFGTGKELPPVELTKDGVTISITGFVDRVDGWVKDGKLYLRVMDYKTGKKSFDLTEIWNGLGLQMLLYLFTLGEEGEKRFRKAVVPAGVLYLPAREVVVSGRRNMSEEARQKKVDEELKRKGILLDEPDVLEAMEHPKEGSVRFLPVKVNGKTGKVSGDSLVSAGQLGRLERHIRRILDDICRELAAGSIAADPFWRGTEKNACQYCDYAEACHFEEGRGGDKRRYLPKVDAGAFWAKLEEKGDEDDAISLNG